MPDFSPIDQDRVWQVLQSIDQWHYQWKGVPLIELDLPLIELDHLQEIWHGAQCNLFQAWLLWSWCLMILVILHCWLGVLRSQCQMILGLRSWHQMMLAMPCCCQELPLGLPQVVRSCAVSSVDNEILCFRGHLITHLPLHEYIEHSTPLCCLLLHNIPSPCCCLWAFGVHCWSILYISMLLSSVLIQPQVGGRNTA